MLRVWWVGFEFSHLQLPLPFHCKHAPLLSLPHNSWERECVRMTRKGWASDTLTAGCVRMMGADYTAFECGSCSEFQAEFAVNRTDSTSDDCHSSRSVPCSATLVVECVRPHDWSNRSADMVGQTNVHRLSAAAADRVLWPLVIGIFRCDRVDSHVTSCFDCRGVCGSNRGDVGLATHSRSAQCLREGLLCSDCWLSLFDRWGLNRLPLIRNFPTHSTAVVWHHNALSQSNLCFFAQKSN